MGLEVFELEYAESQARLREINQADQIASLASTTDLAIRIPHRADGAIVDALHGWLETHGAGLETLTVDAKWIYWDQLPALDVSACPNLLGLRVRGLNLSPRVLEHQRLQQLLVMQCLLAIEEEGLRIGEDHLPSLRTCSFSETRTGASYLEVADAQHLSGFDFGIDADYANGQDPTEFFFSDCPVLAGVRITVPADLTVEVSGDLPALVGVSIHAPERHFDFDHALCRQPLLRSTVHYYDEETHKEPTVPIEEWDGKGSVYWYSFGFKPE